MKHPPQNGKLILFASMLLMVVLGSVHAFSVFLEPLETRFEASRSSVSLTYSLALITLTAIVLFGHRLYGLLKPRWFMSVVCLLAATGTFIAASANQLFFVWIGYSLLFGAANGLGYGYALQISAQANPNSKGLAMGLVTASYALGAALSPWPLAMALSKFGFATAMMGLGLTALLIMPVIMFAYHRGHAHLELPKAKNNAKNIPENQSRYSIILLWLAYGSAVTAGLMAIGHATGIAQESGVSTHLILAAPIILAVFNMSGSLLGGWMADRFSARLVLTILPLISAISLSALSQLIQGSAALIGLAAIGFIYGAIIAIYPSVINHWYGDIAGIRVYGKVFTAWGFAGLFGPWLAGKLYDQYTDYSIALLVAAAAGLLSAYIAFISFKSAT